MTKTMNSIGSSEIKDPENTTLEETDVMEVEEMVEKYEFTGVEKTLEYDYYKIATLHQIRALKDFGDVRAGDIGGWIERESNLSQTDCSWVGDNAIVMGNAVVDGDAIVYDNAVVQNNAVVDENSKVHGNAVIRDYAVISNFSEVYGKAVVKNNAIVKGGAKVYGAAVIQDYARILRAKVYGHAIVKECALVFGSDCEVYGKALIDGSAIVEDSFRKETKVFDNVHVTGRAHILGSIISGNSEIGRNAYIDDHRTVAGDAMINERFEIYTKSVEELGYVVTIYPDKVNGISACYDSQVCSLKDFCYHQYRRNVDDEKQWYDYIPLSTRRIMAGKALMQFGTCDNGF